MTQHFDQISKCVDAIIKHNTQHLIIGTPLGTGKPNLLINSLWERIKKKPDTQLEIFTALSLNRPTSKNLLQKKFLEPFIDKHFKDYPDLQYIKDSLSGTIPKHMKVTEFYLQSGKHLRTPQMQRNYISSNYTHVARDMVDRGINVILQLVGRKKTGSKTSYSLGSNPDLTLDILKETKRKGYQKPLVVGMVSHHMPFMQGDAEIDASFFDHIVDIPGQQQPLFAIPKHPINAADHMIGLYASQLIEDGGTLQIGIGSLGDAFVNASLIRHHNPELFRKLFNELNCEQKFPSLYNIKNQTPYNKGLYAASEMFMDGFEQLYKANILKRKVYDHTGIQKAINDGLITDKINPQILENLINCQYIPYQLNSNELRKLKHIGLIKPECAIEEDLLITPSGKSFLPDLKNKKSKYLFLNECLGKSLINGSILHAAFFLGSTGFYQWLQQLNEQEKQLFQMTTVSRINQLYGGESLDRAQRIKARFINTTMKVNLVGAACSDGLSNHQVVSGVGGQYNFVAMAHALEDSRSILMVRSTRKNGRKIESNIVWDYPYITVPRHLRDIVITEYGYADLRSKSDEECIKSLLCITDSHFQSHLLNTAKKHRKIDPDWSIPEIHTNNYPDKINGFIQKHKNTFPPYPFGSDFTEEEITLINSLQHLKKQTQSHFSTFKTILLALFQPKTPDTKKYLQRMTLNKPQNLQERIAQKLLLWALKKQI